VVKKKKKKGKRERRGEDIKQIGCRKTRSARGRYKLEPLMLPPRTSKVATNISWNPAQ